MLPWSDAAAVGTGPQILCEPPDTTVALAPGAGANR